MLFDGIEILEGSQVVNFTFPTGASFPSSPDQGEIFFKTDVKKPFIYVDSAWLEMTTGAGGASGNSGSGVVSIVAAMTGVTGTEGSLVFSLADDKLFVHDGTSFVECFTENNPKPVTVVSTIVGLTGVAGDLVYSTADSKLFVHDGTSFVPSFVENNPKPVTVVATIVGLTGTEGELVFNSTDNKLYVNKAGVWVSSTPTEEKIYDIGVTAPGDITAASTIVFFVASRSFTIPQAFTGSQAVIGTSNGDATFTIYKNGSSVATINFVGSATVGTFTAASAITFAAGDVLSIDSPAANTPTNLAITLKATI